MTWKVHRYEFTVSESTLDFFGHMNNAVYLRIFEDARWDWISKGGFGLARIRETQTGPVLLEVDLRFKRELKARDEVFIESRVVDVNGKISKVSQVMKFKSSGEDACLADLTMGFFDLGTRKLMPPPLDWLKAIGLENP